MARPRIFISSTYYDLKHIRNSLRAFIDSLGYESVLFEEGDIPFHHDSPLDISCYDEIKKCHILVLIIGGRYGSATSDHNSDNEGLINQYNSITKQEYLTAQSLDIPVYTFIEKNVLSEYHTFKINKGNKSIEYAHVNNVQIFKLIEEIYQLKRNNQIQGFEKLEEIVDYLKIQWAGLFADMLSKKNSNKHLSDLSTQISNLQDINSVLKNYSESILKKLEPKSSGVLIKTSNEKLRKSALIKFFKEPYIKYLTSEIKFSNEDEILKIFIDSSNPTEFHQKLGLSEKFIKELDSIGMVENDYKRIKNDIINFLEN